MDITERMELFRGLVNCSHNICFNAYDAQNLRHLYGSGSETITSFFLTSEIAPRLEALRKKTPQHRAHSKAPIIFTNTIGMAWIIAIEYEDGHSGKLHIMGPAFFNDYSVHSVQEILNRYHVSNLIRREFMEFIESLPVVPLNRFQEYALMLHFCLSGQRISTSELESIDSEEERSTAEIPDFTVKQLHGTYAAEQRMMQMVREGNLQYQAQKENLVFFGQPGDITDQGVIRKIKNYIIIFVAMCSRASMEGGLQPEIAYTLSDYYLTQIERTNQIAALRKISNDMLEDFVRRVHRVKSETTISSQIRTVCDMIAMEPQGDWSIHFFANKLGCSDYYFTKRFKNETGKKFKDYLLEQRIQTAKDLLISTSQPIAEISDLLRFSSQSHFAEHFKRLEGVTPSDYRINHGGDKQSGNTR